MTRPSIEAGNAPAPVASGKPRYGNWMPRKFIIIGVTLGAGFIVAGMLVHVAWVQVSLLIAGAFCATLSCMSILAYCLFSPRGGNLQARIHEFVLGLLPWDGKGTCIDVGCGSGAVSIALAKKHPGARVTGVDYWGNTPFEYSEQQCIDNARIEGVDGRVSFQRADAARLPFDDESFDAIVSNLTFHEVSAFGRGERYKAFLEALRVLKRGGAFAVQDVFKLGVAFGDFDGLQRVLASHVTEIHWVDSLAAMQLPRVLDNPFFIQGMGVFFGRK